jgi:JAB1/Mov34/MPN/PAD-1 ubiquitin protease
LATLELPFTVDGPDPATGEGGQAAGQAAARPYVWQPPGSERRVSIALNVVDQILQEALRGLGSIPRRGAEVGGVLLGALDDEGTLSIHAAIPVACSHSQGSSFTLTSTEYHELSNTVERFAPGQDRPAEAVGFYRTHTREGFGLSMDDARIFDALFPGEWPVILLVKPSITRVSQGAFFFREDGAVRRGSSYMEFPFRRRELSGKGLEDSAQDDEDDVAGVSGDTLVGQATGAAEQQQRGAAAPGAMEKMEQHESNPGRKASVGGNGILGLSHPSQPTEPANGTAGPGRGKSGKAGAIATGPTTSRRWALIPLSFLFLILGLFLGLQSALVVGPHLGKPVDPFSLGLRVKPLAGQKIQIDWNLSSAPIAAAQDAMLYIEDAGAVKPVPLTRTQLTSTSIEYPALGKAVHIRLDVRLRDNAIYSESIDFRR